jgi:hypothetical protein
LSWKGQRQIGMRMMRALNQRVPDSARLLLLQVGLATRTSDPAAHEALDHRRAHTPP